ncbi:MAG: C40 family peptidase [Bacteroidales bacterium]|nr:C40 family peptidase [Bacteroidales bacterium]
MEFGICLNSIIPVRSEPSHTSPMVTQVLFGELFRVMGQDKNWLQVCLAYDDYEGWISALQAQIISESEFIRLYESETFITTDLVQLIAQEPGHKILPIVLGSSLPGLREKYMHIGQYDFCYEGMAVNNSLFENITRPADLVNTRRQLIRDAHLYIQAPYSWGGRSPFGLDCSGFVQMLYKLNHVKLLRDARQQAGQGEIISLLAETEPGDLAFFDDEEGNITHVGMLIDKRRIIHCFGNVHIDPIDHEGIYNEEHQKYTRRLRLIKRMV